MYRNSILFSISTFCAPLVFGRGSVCSIISLAAILFRFRFATFLLKESCFFLSNVLFILCLLNLLTINGL